MRRSRNLTRDVVRSALVIPVHRSASTGRLKGHREYRYGASRLKVDQGRSWIGGCAARRRSTSYPADVRRAAPYPATGPGDLRYPRGPRRYSSRAAQPPVVIHPSRAAQPPSGDTSYPAAPNSLAMTACVHGRVRHTQWWRAVSGVRWRRRPSKTTLAETSAREETEAGVRISKEGRTKDWEAVSQGKRSD